MKTLLATLMLAVITAFAQPAAAKSCKPLHGHFTSMPVPPPDCTSPVYFCTAGDLWGGLHGGYAFTMLSAMPSPEPTTPGVNWFSGVSLITLEDGGSLVGTDNGVVDLNPFGTGKMSSLITITDGADGFEGATGYLQLRGELSFVTGGVSGEYFGEVCR